MNPWIQQIAIAVIAGFILWLASKIFYKRRLYYVVQNLFEHSKLSDGGTVEIVVANLGRRSEEDVQLELVSGLRYELVASTSPNVEIDAARVIRIPRLAPKQQLTLLILAEGNQRFGASHIASLTSRDVIGKVAKDMAEATASDPFAVMIGLGALLAAGGMIGVGGYVVGKEEAETSTVGAVASSPGEEQAFSLGCADFLSNGDKSLSDDALKRLASASVEIKRVVRRGDLVSVDVELTNPVDVETEYSVSLKSPAADSTTKLAVDTNSYIYDVLLLEAGLKRTVSVDNFLPTAFNPQVIWVEVRLEISGGYWVKYERRVSLGRGMALQCPASRPAT